MAKMGFGIKYSFLQLPAGIGVLASLLTLTLDWTALITGGLVRNSTESSPDESVLPKGYDCGSHRYSTEIISLDPLLIYIRDFISPNDIDGLLKAGEGLFNPSGVYKNGVLEKSDR